MDIVKKVLFKYKFPILIASIQWLITTLLQLDKAMFQYEAITPKAVAVKICYFILLLSAWSYGFFVRSKIKEHNKSYERGIFVFAVYFILIMVTTVILWPGTWTWDDIGIMTGVLGYTSFMAWQHFLTGLLHAVLLQVFPHPGVLILVQNLIISICVAFCVVKLENSFGLKILKNAFIDTVIKLIPFIMPPVLLYQFSGYRMGLYVYLEFTMLVIALCAVKQEQMWSWQYALLFDFLAILAASWRSESLIYLPFIFLFLLLLNKRVLTLPKKLSSIVIISLAFLSINSLQKAYLGTGDYEITSMMGTYSAIVRAADLDEDKEQLEIIGKVADIDKILANPEMDGETLFWTAKAYHSDYTDKEFKDSLIAVVKLSLKYPLPVFEERWGVFLDSTGVTGKVFRINWQSIKLFEQDETSNLDEYFQEMGYVPPFVGARKFLINLLSCNTTSGEQISVLRKIVWNAWIPMIALVVAWFNSIRKKNLCVFLIATAVVIRIPLVFLTEPTGWIMYLLSFYFLGYIYLVYKFILCWSKHSLKCVNQS